ncbi:MAG: ferritin-like domain-containing protein [Gelidibacter sp.]|uniref:YciE/YciF ferroxidase family protein n=1 Tax=Gelidibacter sp. TaxID=2018083 RepID=UPI0032666F63
MANTKSKGTADSKASKTSSKGTSKKSSSTTMKSSQLMKLFVDELKDIYWAEKALTKAIPKMIKNATSEKLIAALESHLAETVHQVSRVEEVFEVIGKKATAIKCEAMAGLVKEAEEIMEECEEGPMRDAGIISAGQKVEHYEIASYGTLRQFAVTLGLTKAAQLLEETLKEEKAADKKLTQIAESEVNVEAAEEESK